MTLLTACSNPPAAPPVVSAEPIPVVQPARPAPVKLTRIHWGLCGTMACISIGDEKADLQNRVRIVRWMKQMNAVVDYYESVTTPAQGANSSK